MNSAANESVARAQRAIASARALFRDGLVPECHEQLLKALRALTEAWIPTAERESGSQPDSEGEPALLALEQAGYPHLERLRAALAFAQGAPASDPVRPSHSSNHDEWLWTEIERLNRFTVRHFTPADTLKRARIKLGVAFGLILLISAVFVQRLWGRPHAHASGVFADEHTASAALDGLEGTEWLLPETTPGWIDVLPPKPRALKRVRLTNAHNEYYLDRASKKVRVTAFSEAGPVGSVEGAFEEFKQDTSILDLRLEAQNVVRVRIEVLSFFKRGGGLAEIELL